MSKRLGKELGGRELKRMGVEIQEPPIPKWLVTCLAFAVNPYMKGGDLMLELYHPQSQIVYCFPFGRLEARKFVVQLTNLLDNADASETAKSEVSQLRETDGEELETVSNLPEMPHETSKDNTEGMDEKGSA